MRTILFLLLFSALSDTLSAQSPAGRRVDVSVGWSVADRIGYRDDDPYEIPAEVRSPFFPGADARHTGCITGGLMLSVGRGWSLGFAGSYSKMEIPGEVHYARQGYSFSGRHILSRTVLAAEVRKEYFSKQSVRGYARLGVGNARHNYEFEFASGGSKEGDDVHRSAFVMHISPVGVSVGERVRGFAELGYGYRGLVSLGAAVRF